MDGTPMNTLIELVNAAACGLIAIVLLWMILSPKVHDGVVIKAGLIPMALGFGSIALLLIDGLAPDELQGLERALLLINAGIALVIVGYLLRRASAHHQVRRSTDWAELRTDDMKWPEESHDHR